MSSKFLLACSMRMTTSPNWVDTSVDCRLKGDTDGGRAHTLEKGDDKLKRPKLQGRCIIEAELSYNVCFGLLWFSKAKDTQKEIEWIEQKLEGAYRREKSIILEKKNDAIDVRLEM